MDDILYLDIDDEEEEIYIGDGAPDIPTKTSELTNDSGFITKNDIPEVDIPDIPTKTSELKNDSGFIESNYYDDMSLTPNPSYFDYVIENGEAVITGLSPEWEALSDEEKGVVIIPYEIDGCFVTKIRNLVPQALGNLQSEMIQHTAATTLLVATAYIVNFDIAFESYIREKGYLETQISIDRYPYVYDSSVDAGDYTFIYDALAQEFFVTMLGEDKATQYIDNAMEKLDISSLYKFSISQMRTEIWEPLLIEMKIMDAFYGFSEIFFSSTIEVIENDALCCALGLSRVVFPRYCNLKIIGDNNFSGEYLHAFDVPFGVTSIGANNFLFTGPYQVCSVPDTVFSIGKNCFGGEVVIRCSNNSYARNYAIVNNVKCINPIESVGNSYLYDGGWGNLYNLYMDYGKIKYLSVNYFQHNEVKTVVTTDDMEERLKTKTSTTLPYILSVDTVYAIEPMSNITIRLPTTADIGNFIQVDFSTDDTPPLLSITGPSGLNYDDFIPEANMIYSLYFDWGITDYDNETSTYMYGWRFSYAEYPKMEG